MRITGFDKLLTDVRRLEENLARPTMYAERRAEYHAHAVQVARETLTIIRPPDVSPEEWKRRVDLVVARVMAEVLVTRNGILFSVSSPELAAADGSLAPNDSRPASQVMSFEDIKEWIRAGQKGEPGGKIITAEDAQRIREQGIDAVASIVMKAYYSAKPDSRYTRLRAAIQRYMLGSRATAAAPLLDTIATAWAEHFSSTIPRDLKTHAAKLCREF
jgi:hypothetical protein